MSEIEVTNQTAQEEQSPEVKRKHGGGPKPKGYYERGLQDRLSNAAPDAVTILDNHMNQRRGYKTIKESVLKTCFYIIDHAIGKARQKIEHSGGILTYAELSKGADELDKKPRDILADVEEIANKVEGKTDD